MTKRANAWSRLADELREMRSALGLTQRELARRIGRPPPRVSELESGEGDPRISTVIAVASALGMELMVVPAARVRELRRLIGRSPVETKPETVFEELAIPDEDEDESE